MGVERGGDAAATAEELIEGHAGELALDVPERDINAGEGVVEHGTTPPVGADRGGLEDILDIVWAAAEEKRFEVLLDRGDDGEGSLGEGGAAEAKEPRLAGLHLDDD